MAPNPKKAAYISRIRLITAMPFGPTAMMEQHIGIDSWYGEHKVKLFFDGDDRFVRVEIGPWTGLVPFSNIGMLQVVPAE